MVQRQLERDHMEIAIYSVGGEWPKKDKRQVASAPRAWHGDRIWGEWVLVCVCAEFAEGDFRTRPRLVRWTLYYVVDLNGKLREKMEGGERGSRKS